MRSCLVRLFLRSICLILLILFVSACSKTIVLYKDFSEVDANEVIAMLLENGIAASKRSDKSGVTVLIDELDMARAVAILKASGLPNRSQTNIGEVFKKEGIISTPLEERARYIYALSQELEFTLSQLEGVIIARVHIVLPERIAPGEPIQPSSAAVFIKHLPQLDPDVITRRIKHMVASSIPGLSGTGFHKISVVFTQSSPARNTIQWETFGPFKVAKASVVLLQYTLISCFMVILLFMGLLVTILYPKTNLWLQTKFNFLPATSDPVKNDK
ncbi:type III secretion inner membrane ring lipoprotein SctJ [Endozoicomonas sp. SM1973]|uniref:Lipoprotein n=1 Tax=Spartinivicinus marinus TaxID=2994442 RepID=A0A853I8G0_9GAMM|nr:type III secretion inner membrane ring lipoprotein SctJ [Spartinivicinus marinus]MCX4028154.1 type III secretion inner membrane ring lipoprotein SctJ [Spartinivicinus marinus]NYZ66171.1 type III secretion inner membrane ring lipoprotein SctJ [Spartinivicinus marinus]